jgi:chitin synthase
MGLLSTILVLMAGVGFLTFGFTTAVCGKPPDRFHGGAIDATHISNNSVVFHGYSYNFSDFKHPSAGPFNGQSNPLTDRGWNLTGNDASFLFQKTNQQCLGVITKAPSSSITGQSNFLDWYFPCNVYSQYGGSGANLTGYESGTNCHSSSKAHSLFSQISPSGQVYYTWDDVKNPDRNLAVYESYVDLFF